MMQISDMAAVHLISKVSDTPPLTSSKHLDSNATIFRRSRARHNRTAVEIPPVYNIGTSFLAY